jgi:hypothetical protein
MTEAESTFKECERRGILLTIGERSSELAFDAPVGALTAELRELLVKHKPEIIEMLFEAEERASLSGCPEQANAGQWVKAVESPKVQAMLRIFGGEIVSVRCGNSRSD